MMKRSLRPLLLSFAAVSLLAQSMERVVVAGEPVSAAEARPCAEALAPGEPGENTPEEAIVRAWMDLCLPEASAPGDAALNGWARELVGSLRAGAEIETAFTAPREFLSSEAREGVDSLQSVVSALVLEGAIQSVGLAGRLARRLETRLNESHQAVGVLSEIREEREEVRLRVHSVRVGGALENPVLQLPDGMIVAASSDGNVVFTDRHGTVRAKHAFRRSFYGSPVRLGGGKVLLLSGLGRSVLFEPDGSSYLEVETPEVHSNVRPLVLDNGGVMIPGRFGTMTILAEDGMEAMESWVKERHVAQPKRLADGRIALGTEEGQLKLYSADGQLLKRVDIGAKIIHDVAQFSDGTILVAEEFSRVHFVNADGTPKRSWLGFSLHVDLKKRIAFAPIALPDGRVAVITTNGLVTVMTSEGKIDFQAWTSSTIDVPPLLLGDGSLLLVTGEAGMGTPETEFFRVTPQGKATSIWLTGDTITSEPVLLPGGEVALGTKAGEWVVLDPLAPEGMREISRGHASGPLRMRSTLLADGGIAVGGDAGELLLFDPELAKEGFSF